MKKSLPGSDLIDSPGGMNCFVMCSGVFWPAILETGYNCILIKDSISWTDLSNDSSYIVESL